MDWQAFFKGFENHSVSAIYYDNNTGLTVERLYQAFEARLLDKIATSLLDEGVIETPDFAYLEKSGWVRKDDENDKT